MGIFPSPYIMPQICIYCTMVQESFEAAQILMEKETCKV